MKKQVFSFLFCFFVFATLVFPAFSQEALSPTLSPTPTIEYQLPYPGLLPDSPLYFIKTFRDRLMSYLISDPLKKAEFDLLQADKRLTAGVALAHKGSYPLATSTISKGENYFFDAVVNTQAAKKQGVNINSMRQKLLLALLKHQEVLTTLSNQAPKQQKASFETLQKRLEAIRTQIDNLPK